MEARGREEGAGRGLLAAKGAPSLRRTALSASVYVFLSYLAVAMGFAPFNSMVLLAACEARGLDREHCKASVPGAGEPGNPAYDEAQKAAALALAGFTLATGLAQLSTCALLGCIGDSKGRRVPLCLPLVNGCVGGFAAGWSHGGISCPLTAFCSVASLLGGMYVSNHAVFAALADSTQNVAPQDRSYFFGLVEGMIWLGLLVGPALGGLLSEAVGNRHCFLLIGCVHVFNLLLTLGTFRETLEPGRRHAISWQRANPFRSLGMFLETRTTTLLAVTLLAGGTAWTGGGTVLTLYAMRWPDVSESDVGLIISVNSGVPVVGLTLVFPILMKCLSLQRHMALSCLNSCICWLLISCCTSKKQLMLATCCQILSANFFPIVRTGIVNTFGKERYGESLAAVGVAEQISYMLAGPLMEALYRSSEDTVLLVAGQVRVSCVACLGAATFALAAHLAACGVRGFPEARASTSAPGRELPALEAPVACGLAAPCGVGGGGGARR